ncbi:MAG: RIP metalloprotease RseP [Candidatus Acidiferrales bacterium]
MAHILSSLSSVGYILIAIFSLGLVVIIHEAGHFLVARYFGVRVDVFSFGFGPRLLGIKRGPTDYRISALPFGGYVRMAGDNPSEERAGAPDEFLSKPRWQRMLIAVAGPAMNCVLAIVMFAFIFGGASQAPIYSDKPVDVVAVKKDSTADKAGIKPGDRLVSINGTENPTWDRASWEAKLTAPNILIPVSIERQGQLISTNVPSSMIEADMFGEPADRIVVYSITPDSPAQKAGLHPGDEIVSVNGEHLQAFRQFVMALDIHGDRPIEIGILRNGHPENIHLRPVKKDYGDGLGMRWTVGFLPEGMPDKHTVKKGVVESVEFSLWFSGRLCQQFMQTIGQLFVGKASPKQFLGPLGIVTYSGQAARAGSRNLSIWMALISLNLAVLNLLPIPILDGGHILMLAIESVIRQDLSLKTKERFIQVGFVFILLIFAFVMYNDVLRMFTHS